RRWCCNAASGDRQCLAERIRSTGDRPPSLPSGAIPVFKGRSPLPALLLIVVVCLSAYASLGAQGTKGTNGKAPPQWIWLGAEARPNQTVYFRKEFALDKAITAARLSGTCDNRMTVYINGKEALSSDNWETPVSRDVTEFLKSPVSSGDEVRNVICVKAHN